MRSAGGPPDGLHVGHFPLDGVVAHVRQEIRKPAPRLIVQEHAKAVGREGAVGALIERRLPKAGPAMNEHDGERSDSDALRWIDLAIGDP
jgi:hypothetical protein